ncbi:Oxysterol binding protein [Tritrichomonas foetus]|uniref:Oxysterol binding protein n=1 Tax=Tritrichomonas foetus TaxID=1144522 RepID=A0A1J4JIF7_9EUKA|nr:Oxysterol binding protein [Tritrichomonas foetus]|eukprot:OHS97331.1 Oxysterol binding protein [Tritrichomonas foetus]
MSLYNRNAAPVKSDAQVMGTLEGKDIYNTSFTGVPKTELKLPDDDYAGERERAKTRNSDYGVKPMTQEELDAERALSWVLLKKFTMSIFKMDFTRFSFPVGYSEQRSFLERTADLFTFIADDYAQQMVNCSVPETRLQLLATGICAGFYIYLQSKKPWNPVLGETYYGKWPNGVEIFGEQSSHHPPISDFQIFGPNNSWKCHARCNFTINSGVFQVDVVQRGTFYLEFADGTTYEWEFPTICVQGIIRGDRYVLVKGPLIVKDTFNDLTVQVDIAPKADRSKGIAKQRQTTLYGGILDGTGKNFISKITGDYTEKIEVDGEELWNIDTKTAHRPTAQVDEEMILPSDCRFRIDRMYLIKENIEVADEAKIIIEEAQRREEKLRDCIPAQA